MIFKRYGVITIYDNVEFSKYFILVTMVTIHKIQVLTICNILLKIMELSKAHCVVSSKSTLKYITKLIFCESNTIWKTLSQNADVTKTIPLAEKKKKKKKGF